MNFGFILRILMYILIFKCRNEMVNTICAKLNTTFDLSNVLDQLCTFEKRK